MSTQIPNDFNDGPPASHSRHLVFSQCVNSDYACDVTIRSSTESLSQGREFLIVKFPQSCEPKTVLNLLDKMKLSIQGACNQTWQENL